MTKPKLCLEHALTSPAMFAKLPHLDRATRTESPATSGGSTARADSQRDRPRPLALPWCRKRTHSQPRPPV